MVVVALDLTLSKASVGPRYSRQRRGPSQSVRKCCTWLEHASSKFFPICIELIWRDVLWFFVVFKLASVVENRTDKNRNTTRTPTRTVISS